MLSFIVCEWRIAPRPAKLYGIEVGVFVGDTEKARRGAVADFDMDTLCAMQTYRVDACVVVCHMKKHSVRCSSCVLSACV